MKNVGGQPVALAQWSQSLPEWTGQLPCDLFRNYPLGNFLLNPSGLLANFPNICYGFDPQCKITVF